MNEDFDFTEKFRNMLISYNRLMLVLIGIVTLLTAQKEQHYIYGNVVCIICILLSQLHINTHYMYFVKIKCASENDIMLLTQRYNIRNGDTNNNDIIYIPLISSKDYPITEKDFFKSKIDKIISQDIHYNIEEVTFIGKKTFLSFKKYKENI